MTRLFCVGIVVAAVLFAVPALASVPYPANCTVAWFQPVVGDTLILVCPQGDATKLDVTVKDQFNLPIAGQVVTATFASGNVVVSGAISGITDASGYVRLTIKAGLNASLGKEPRVSSSYTVTCMGVILKTATTSLVSPDMNGDLNVEALDNAMFAADYLSTGGSLRSDYNDDKTVEALDNAIFAAHYLHIP